MTSIESKEVTVPEENEKVFRYLTDLRNYQELLPEGKFSEWQGHEDSCQFKLTGVARVGLEIKETDPFDRILLNSSEETPLPFELVIRISDLGDGRCSAQLTGYAEMNPFLRQMVKTPLKNLFDHMADKLVTVWTGN